MSTLAEIEAAVEELPAADQYLLLQHLEMRVLKKLPQRARVVVENDRPVLSAAPGAPEMTPELIRALRDGDA